MTMLEVSLQIFRYKAGEPPHYDTFTIQVADTAHVLDAIDIAWAVHDHSLTFRRACHHSSCGACALRIDGVEKLPCVTPITDVWDGHSPLRLDPLRNFPIVSDLVVDMSGFFQRMSASDLAAIYRARQETDDPQEAAHLLALADGEHGVWRCHSAFECTEACPQAVDPARKIMALRRELTAQRFKKRRRR
jgi:succinate dehydrogenase/fumarate reductase-like Fe-S protein